MLGGGNEACNLGSSVLESPFGNEAVKLYIYLKQSLFISLSASACEKKKEKAAHLWMFSCCNSELEISLLD